MIKGLYGIVDNTFSPERSHVDLATGLLVGGCKILQLRIKRQHPDLWDGTVFDIAHQIMGFKKRYDFTFIINDYVDVAAEVGADGVHVGANDLAIDKIRERTGGKLPVGYSSHSVEEAIEAERQGAAYVALGAIYPTKTKGPGHPVQGLSKLREVVARLKCPVVAVGGIGRDNIDDVLKTGVSSVAMITALTQAEDMVAETRWFVEQIQNPGTSASPKNKVQSSRQGQSPKHKNSRV